MAYTKFATTFSLGLNFDRHQVASLFSLECVCPCCGFIISLLNSDLCSSREAVERGQRFNSKLKVSKLETMGELPEIA